MKFSEFNFCAVCKHRHTCTSFKEGLSKNGTTCLAWQPYSTTSVCGLVEGEDE